jgi:hypothetical protein
VFGWIKTTGGVAQVKVRGLGSVLNKDSNAV